MKSCVRLGAALAVALCLPACATITRGTSQKYAIESTPAGAAVTLSTGQKCTTPCKLKLKRKTGFTAKFAKDGYQPIEAEVKSEMHGGGGTALVGNALIGGLVGVAVDSTNGSLNDLRPNPLKVTLVASEAAPADQPAPGVPAAAPAGEPAPAATAAVATEAASAAPAAATSAPAAVAPADAQAVKQ